MFATVFGARFNMLRRFLLESTSGIAIAEYLRAFRYDVAGDRIAPGASLIGFTIK